MNRLQNFNRIRKAFGQAKVRNYHAMETVMGISRQREIKARKTANAVFKRKLTMALKR